MRDLQMKHVETRRLEPTGLHRHKGKTLWPRSAKNLPTLNCERANRSRQIMITIRLICIALPPPASLLARSARGLDGLSLNRATVGTRLSVYVLKRCVDDYIDSAGRPALPSSQRSGRGHPETCECGRERRLDCHSACNNLEPIDNHTPATQLALEAQAISTRAATLSGAQDSRLVDLRTASPQRPLSSSSSRRRCSWAATSRPRPSCPK